MRAARPLLPAALGGAQVSGGAGPSLTPPSFLAITPIPLAPHSALWTVPRVAPAALARFEGEGGRAPGGRGPQRGGLRGWSGPGPERALRPEGSPGLWGGGGGSQQLWCFLNGGKKLPVVVRGGGLRALPFCSRKREVCLLPIITCPAQVSSVCWWVPSCQTPGPLPYWLLGNCNYRGLVKGCAGGSSPSSYVPFSIILLYDETIKVKECRVIECSVAVIKAAGSTSSAYFTQKSTTAAEIPHWMHAGLNLNRWVCSACYGGEAVQGSVAFWRWNIGLVWGCYSVIHVWTHIYKSAVLRLHPLFVRRCWKSLQLKYHS